MYATQEIQIFESSDRAEGYREKPIVIMIRIDRDKLMIRSSSDRLSSSSCSGQPFFLPGAGELFPPHVA